MTARVNRCRTSRLVRGFDRVLRRTHEFLEARYGRDLADHIVAEARLEFARLIPELPDLQAREPFTQFVSATGWFLAFHRALSRNGRPVSEAGGLAYTLTAQYVTSIPRFVALLIRWVWFSKPFQMRVRFRAEQSQKHRQKGEFVFEYVPGEAQKFDYGVDYIECAAWSFLERLGAPELAPYVCALDQLYSDAFGWGLVRTMTLAEGGSRCDFRFKRGRETSITSSVLPLREI